MFKKGQNPKANTTLGGKKAATLGNKSQMTWKGSKLLVIDFLFIVFVSASGEETYLRDFYLMCQKFSCL